MAEAFLQSNQTGLFSLPEEVIYRCVFPLLSHRDLLRLRYVCKSIKIFSDEFIRNHFNTQFREINETTYTFKHFIEANLPTSCIYLNNLSSKFFEDPDIADFLRIYDNQTSSLRVRHFGTCISEPELHFFSNLPNLIYLDFDFIDASQRKCQNGYEDVNGLKIPLGKTPFPATFKNLKTLKFNLVQGSDKFNFGYTWDFIGFCDKLEYLKHPLFKDMVDGISDHFESPFGCVINHIRRRHINYPNLPNLKYYDLQNHQVVEASYSFPFCDLLKLCYEYNIKLVNVDSSILDVVHTFFRTTPEKFGTPLHSLRNADGHMFYAELPDLEKLTILSTAESSFTDAWTWTSWREVEKIEIPKWSNLKILDLKIDSENMLGCSEFRRKRTQDFLDFLFEFNTKREEVHELAIRFSRGADRRGIELPVPRVQDVTRTCPFVTRLTLTNWLGSNKTVSKFWMGLPLLEDVTLESCTNMGDVAFVGKKCDDPVFLKLKKLKRLTLRNLHMMPKLTDQVFKSVFCNLKIKEFHITSNRTIKSITVSGIESLLNGSFNNYVERFPFDTWTLDGVTKEDLAQLELRFKKTYLM